MTTLNTALLTAAMGLITLGSATISTNLMAGGIEFFLGIVAIIVYEKLPPSPTA